MSYQSMFSFAFQNLPGLTLNAKLFDSAGAQTGSTITSGFDDLGDGAYQYLATIPNGHVGTLKIYDSTQPSRCIPLAVNPQELENADAKTSTRSTFAGGTVASVTGNVGGNVIGSVGSVTNPVTVGTNNDKTGYALSSAGIQAIWDALTSALTTVGSIGKRLVDNLDAAISTRLDLSGYTTPPTVTQIRTEMDSNSTKLDATVSSRSSQSSVNALNNLSQSQAQSAAAASLSAYGAATATNVSSTQTAITTAIAALNDLSDSDIVTALQAMDIETGHSFLVVLRALYALLRNNSEADDPTNPTTADYYAPDGVTVRVHHDLTPTTRTVS